MEVKGQKAKREGQTGAFECGVGLVAMATGWVPNNWKENGREGEGACGPKDKAGPAGVGGAKRGYLTQQRELAGAQMPSPGEEGRMAPGGEAVPRPGQAGSQRGANGEELACQGN